MSSSRLTPAEFADACRVPIELAERWCSFVVAAADRFSIDSPLRLAMFLAQCGVESRGFTAVVENLNYSAAALLRTWPSHFSGEADARALERKPELIANRVYANRMGNGPESSGDGWRFRGQGLIQLTGRANFAACSRGLGLDLVATPELLREPRYAALSAGWFWQTRALNAFADRADVVGATKKINGGTNGLAQRRARYEWAAAVLLPQQAEAA